MRDLETIVLENYKDTRLFVRDLFLDEKVVSCYQEGLTVTEPSFVEMTYKIGGMNDSMNTRFIILSNRASNMEELETDTSWGLYVIHTHAYFKVLKNTIMDKKNIIILLHIKEEDVLFFNEHTISLDDNLCKQVLDKVNISLKDKPILEIDNDLWYRHVNFPIGIKDDGSFYKPKEEI